MIFIDAPLAASVALSLVVAGPLFFWVNNQFKVLALLRGDRMADSSGRMLEYVQGISVCAGIQPHRRPTQPVQSRRIGDATD